MGSDGSLGDEFNASAEDLRLEESLASARRQRDEARRALRHAVQRADAAEGKLEFIQEALAAEVKVKKRKEPNLKPHRGAKAIVCAMLSDAHFDEVVNPDEVNGLNAYNRDIAELRLRRFFDKVATLPHHYLKGPEFEGLVLAIGGDMLSGDIHEELAQTNETTPVGTCLHWSEQIASGIQMLSEVYPWIHVVAVCGNHGRRTRKERAKMRAIDNFDYLLAHMARRGVSAENVTWDIPEEADARFSVYGVRYLLTHGNLGFGGGGGVAGIWSPIMRGDLKRRQREGGNAYDVLLCGHWHQLKWGGSFIVNGSLKGTDEFAWANSFGNEPPQQALWVVTPEHGQSWHMPIHVCDRSAEGW